MKRRRSTRLRSVATTSSSNIPQITSSMVKTKTKRPKIKIQKNSLALKHKEFLTLLAKTKDKKRRNKLIDAGDNNEIRAISECIMNIIQGNVPITKSQLKQLKQHKNVLRSLSKKCYSMKRKKIILKQKGGFLPALLPMALKAIGGFLLPMIFNNK